MVNEDVEKLQIKLLILLKNFQKKYNTIPLSYLTEVCLKNKENIINKLWRKEKWM